MFKKITAVLVIAVVLAASVFAGVKQTELQGSMQVGVAGRFAGSDITAVEEYKVFENYRYGGDMRFNFDWFNITGGLLVGAVHEENTELVGSIAANFRLDLELFDFTLGAGYELPFEFGKEGMMIDGKPVTQAIDVFNRSTLYGHLGAGLNLGNLGIAVDYHLSYDSIMKMVDDYDNVGVEPMKEGWVSISVLCKVF